MNHLLKKNDSLQTTPTGSIVYVKEFIAEGGQGEVYLGHYNNQKVAIKWYFNQSANKEQYSILKNLVTLTAPNNNFLWPIELVTSPNKKGFGYIMPLRPSNFHSLVKIINRSIRPDFTLLCTIAFNIVKSFYELHSNGLSYCDINFGNIFFDPQTGDILVCDLDNVTFDGTSEVGVTGTARFMAPEIVRGESGPNMYTDLYSMAVLLYYIFYLEHPLHGRQSYQYHCFDQNTLDHIYGHNPIYTFSQFDNSNRPVPGIHDNPILFDSIYPQFFKNLFHDVFTKGLKDAKNGRIAESIWMKRLLELKDLIVTCPNCGALNFLDPDELSTPKKCWNCGKSISQNTYLCINNKRIILDEGKRISSYYLSGDCFNTEPIAKVAIHPEKKILGLKNLSNKKWACTIKQQIVEILPNQTVKLVNEMIINFGSIKGVIHA